ncbi:MAG: signal peptidase I [Parcubacteria group bacterium CG1_02_40_82]|uniref:Signal peptidase I n=3 Tax=Candidatus Portnoyibacteriota TaxID=1817913 RepID=A0A2H0KT96_9BACT|nr:MAG: signal peptidase I [Parcubacteria group bacterium CG1_02_40_82]PIQ75379.1 MAG: signal peptidase I [Candidatus Portnoybacteria bacterium CG11_big_fil_rev_8_21_14_0_20_40_15]PIS31512.1 MAG: signal peptidase I [Candidatus Portnoybacteria bacterium CG08_land_8_20_14_0_20_40_83]PIY74864.1 MAG: signal peptidase I [Candidatus Portnoybacteria bacterium CG_4_10_14_0_8_um_filter_40_50]PJA64866.1 MAG: signal peptidase I [Candidatus Portnoybacteria bacterium CG_4_9_14_3_um_filter_40_10]
MKSFLILVWEIFKILVVSLAIIIPIRYFLIQPFFVQGASMEPNYQDGEYLIIDEVSYRLGEPLRGEVVVFKYPQNPSEFFIKRIIGLPGETIKIDDIKIIIENKANPEGFVLDESSYLKNVPPMGQETTTLKENEFFVLGDNRAASFDSRRWGPLPRNNIVGRVWVKAWPISQAGIAHAPNY